MKKVKPKDKPHYVNNKEFSQRVVDYVELVNKMQKENKSVPIVDNYIASCFLKIAEGLSHKSNFIRYTYREEMVMDAVENCLRAIMNYDIETATRTGSPNAFAYFTQICYYAFIRRITKEKKHQEIKFRFIEKAGIENFINSDDENNNDDTFMVEQSFFDELRSRIDRVKETDQQLKEFIDGEKKYQKASRKLELFMG